MQRLIRTYRIVILLVVSLLMAGSTAELYATPIETTTYAYEYITTNYSHDAASKSHVESLVAEQRLATIEFPAQGTLPTVRTIARSPRQTLRTDHYVVAARSIDSTQAKSRAGLFNHKILFYTYPRHYYQNGLVRLII